MFKLKQKINSSKGIANISGGDNNKKTITFNPNSDKGKNEISIDGKIIPLPNKQKREVLYISGPSGSGKTHWVAEYIKQYKKIFKNNDIFFISSISYDKVIDDIKGIIRLSIDENSIDEPFDLEDFQDSLVIFDDCDTIQNKNVRVFIDNLRNFLLEQGRHTNTYMLITAHQLSNYKQTRIVLNEATGYVLFPKSNGTKLKKFLENYAGLDNKEFSRIKDLPSRWVYLVKSYPNYVIYEKGVYVI